MSAAPWSPSAAREAARAALCRYLHGTFAPGLPGFARRLLAEDRAFDSPEALDAAMTGPGTWIVQELRDLVTGALGEP